MKPRKLGLGDRNLIGARVTDCVVCMTISHLSRFQDECDET